MIRRCLLALCITLALAGALVPAASAQQEDQVARDTIAQINAFRMQQGLSPLKPNDTLQALALVQAQYLLSLPDLPDDMHTDQQGQGPHDRAQRSPYNWPNYGRPEQVAVEEIAYAGHSVNAAITWWQGSTIHRNTILNPAYREIGVAVLPHTFGHLFIVVVGGRPNVLPALVDTATGTLYLTSDRFRSAGNNGSIRVVTQVRFFDSQGRPLGSWQPWQASLPVPAGAGDRLYVESSDGTVQVLSEVDLATDTVLLPGSFAAAPAAPAPTQAAAVPTLPPPTQAVVAPTRTPVPAANTSSAQPATPTPVSAAPSRGEVLLVYDSRSLAVINTSDQAVDLSQLVLSRGAILLPITRWQGAWLTAPLSAFPAHDCLQVWAFSDPSEPAKPATCNYLRSGITITAEQRFWTEGSFDVFWQDTHLTSCQAQAGQCAVDLP